MKTIGLIGGMSWESTLEYYRLINELTGEKLGKLHSAKIIMYSVDFEEIQNLQHLGNWTELGNTLADIAIRLENAGAEIILICTNTMHKVAQDVQEKISIPLLHIADTTAEEIKSRKAKTVGLLGTKFTMEEDFYKKRFKEKHGIDVVIPTKNQRQYIHDAIYNELCFGVMKDSTKQRFLNIINELVSNAAEGIVLGCTEIPLLIKQEDCKIPIFNTMQIHAKEAVNFSVDVKS